jgi:hypothetical protein
MKKLFVSIALVGLLIAGCENSKDIGIVGPDNSANSVNTSTNQVSFLKMPGSLLPRPMHKSIPFLITPQSGGVLHYSDSYQSADGPVTIDIKLNFPPGAVADSMIVSVDISNEEMTGDITMDFGPSPTTFLKPALLTFNVTGVGSTLPSDTSKVEFVYLDNGNYVPMDAKKISINSNQGTLTVLDGQVPHFSRYAWATKN